MMKRIRIKMHAYYIYEKLPLLVKHILSYALHRPKLGRGAAIRGLTACGKNVSVGDYSFVKQAHYLSDVKIGKFSSIALGLSVGNGHHPYESFSTFKMSGDASPFGGRRKKSVQQIDCSIKTTTIGNDVWIGDQVNIKNGVTIGDGAVIGSKSMVTRDVPPYAIVAGNPARIIKYRFEQEKIELMLRLKWWDWPLEKIYDNLERLDQFDVTLLNEVASLPVE